MAVADLDGRDLDECDARRTVMLAADFPSIRSPHEVRRVEISYYLTEQRPARVLSDRADVSEDVLDKRYDVRAQEERTAVRRELFE